MTQTIQPSYCTATPSDQTAVDILKGLWKSAFPAEKRIQAGDAPNFNDPRVAWVAEQIGDLHGKSVLELGPYEAYHTYQLSRHGAFPITAIEGNNINYLKCLIVKEVLDIRARFLYGDILGFASDTSESYDLCWACGVLYHQVDPLMFLKAVARSSKRIFFWTHFFDNRIVEHSDQYPNFDSMHDVEKDFDGYRCRHYYRSYRSIEKALPAYFSGGSESFSYWLSKDDVLGYLAVLGFTDITVRGINMEHKAGPTISFLACRPDQENEV